MKFTVVVVKWLSGRMAATLMESLVVTREAVRRDMRVLKWWRASDVDDVWIISNSTSCLSF